MTEQSPRDRILSRLRSGPRQEPPTRPDWMPPAYAAEERRDRFVAMLESSHAEVHRVGAADWPARLRQVLEAKGISSLAYGPGTEAGRQLAAEWGEGGPALVPYDRPVEDFKQALVSEIGAGFTTTRGGIAQTGSLVLWPTPEEPRLLSLLPPVHVTLVEEAALTDTLAATLAAQNWAAGMPTNAVLVSGPSKTADIEQTLAYGVHGPKELIVLLMEGPRP